MRRQNRMDLKPGQRFIALDRQVAVGQKFRDQGVIVEVVRVLTEEETKEEVPEFHLGMRAICPDEELYWAECKALVS